MKWSVPPLFQGQTIVCIASGPSLTQADVDRCRGVRTVVVNDGYRLAPWADVLYAADAKWWTFPVSTGATETHLDATKSFAGIKVSPGWLYQARGTQMERKALKGPQRTKTGKVWPADIKLIEVTKHLGLHEQPTCLCSGGNGGYQAIGLAVHLGARRILLLGYDMKRGRTGAHWFGDHAVGGAPPVSSWVPAFTALVKPLKARGIDILNCSRDTALKCFPRVPLERALACEVAA